MRMIARYLKRLHFLFVTETAEARFVDSLTRASSGRFYRFLPPLPHLRSKPPIGPRSLAIPELPEQLRTSPGIPREPLAEAAAFAAAPLQIWTSVHAEAAAFIRHHSWTTRILDMPTKIRYTRLLAREPTTNSGVARVDLSASELTRRVKERAAELGLSAVGVARYDPKYTFEPYLSQYNAEDRIVVCILEQSWVATQKVPSAAAERGHHGTYERLVPMAERLASFLRSLGYYARTDGPDGRGMSIHYAVEAGLGQLGLNGQLLTPFAGSRCRIVTIATDAQLIPDAPKDYGVPALCDSCKTCVRRCPSGAITSQRKMHRGVYKAKIKTERCLPMVALAYGCAICMKVCPVQRYGLPLVIEEFTKTGKVLGVHTEELEGYVWPVDGRYYGPDEKPKSAVSQEMLHPRGLVFDPERKLPGPKRSEIETTV